MSQLKIKFKRPTEIDRKLGKNFFFENIKAHSQSRF